MENILDKTTQYWVRLTGKKIDPELFSWLIGPVGEADRIGDHFFNRLAEREGLILLQDQPDFGLLERIDQLGLSAQEAEKLHPSVADFYEHTSSYRFEFWSEWCGFFRPFGFLLSSLFSKRLQQLNLPLNSMDASRGLSSKVIKLNKHDKTLWTIWFRRLRATKRVIYSGVYTTCVPQNASSPHLKVVFPLPNGNATVIMTPSVEADGALMLSSNGKRFGDNGFYFTLTDHKGKYWAKFVKPMHEWIRVYVDEEQVLRADHQLYFYGKRFLNLHYKMEKKIPASM